MSNEYYAIYLIATSLIPQLVIAIIFPAFLIGLAVRFMRNPDKY